MWLRIVDMRCRIWVDITRGALLRQWRGHRETCSWDGLGVEDDEMQKTSLADRIEVTINGERVSPWCE